MKAVDELQLNLLSELMSFEFLKDYFLVGGTNLALRENHRKSIDLDLFANKDFDVNYNVYINTKLKEHFGNSFTTTSVSDVGIFGVINGVKVDFINFPYKLLQPIEILNNWRLATKLDVAAMKINAVTGRGSKKDFYDIAKLLEVFSIKEMLAAYQEMFKVDNVFMAVKSLSYFADAENSTYINNNVIPIENKSWENVKAEIKLNLTNYNNKKRGLNF